MRIKLYCPDCDRAYSWDTDSIEHINSVHYIYCGRKFSRKTSRREFIAALKMLHVGSSPNISSIPIREI